MMRYRILIAVLAGAALAVPPAGAEEPSRLEFFVRGAWTPAATGTAYFHSYDPNPGYEIPGSYARQTLQVDPLAGSGLQAGLTVFFGRTVGIRLSVGRDETPFGGINAPFEMSYKYTTWIFPFVPVSGTKTTTTEWPDTSGALRRTTIGLEAVIRIPLGSSFSLRLSGGPLLEFFGGEIHSLAYNDPVIMKGAVSFDSYFVLLRLPPRTIVGFTGGADLSLRLGRHLVFVFGAAYRSGSYSGTPEIMAAYYGYLEASAADMDRIKARIAPGPIELTPSPLLFGAGLAVVF